MDGSATGVDDAVSTQLDGIGPQHVDTVEVAVLDLIVVEPAVGQLLDEDAHEPAPSQHIALDQVARAAVVGRDRVLVLAFWLAVVPP